MAFLTGRHRFGPRSTALTLLAAVCLTSAAGPASAPATRPADAPVTTTPAAPATRPATGPTTGPSAAELEARALARKLVDSGWRERERVTGELVRMGEDARATLNDLVRTAPGGDVRDAALRALRLIDENRQTGPTFVTLRLKDVPAPQAFAELFRQAGLEMKAYPDNMWEHGTWNKVTIDLERQPFWVAMREVGKQTGVELREVNNQMRLMQGGGQMDGPFAVHGPFMIVANQITRTQVINLGAGGQRAPSDDNFGVQLSAYAEPKLRVVRSAGGVKLEEVVDDKGNSLLPPATHPNEGGYYGGGEGVWTLYARLQYPEAKAAGSRIRKLRGSTAFTVQTKSQRIEVGDLFNMKDNAQVVGGTRVVFKDFKKQGEGSGLWHLRLTIARGNAAAPGDVADALQSTVYTRLKVLDAKGRPLDHRGYSSTGRNEETEMTLHFGQGHAFADGQDQPSGDPVKLVWEVPTETRDVTVPFEFTDLPLPGP